MNSGETRQIFENRKCGGSKAYRLQKFFPCGTAGTSCVCAGTGVCGSMTKERVGDRYFCRGCAGALAAHGEPAGKNTMPVERVEYIENTFEHQFLIKNRDVKMMREICGGCQKKSFMETAELPEYLYFPPEHLMLLRD